MSKINPLAEGVVKMVRQQMMLHLSQVEDIDLNVYEKQIKIKETINKALQIAKSSPNGEVSIVFLNSAIKRKNTTALDLIKNEKVRISFFNTNKKEGHLERTFIFIDSKKFDFGI